MYRDVYVVLGGEHQKKRERSNKVIDLYEADTRQFDEHPHSGRTVILTGCEGWTFDVPSGQTKAAKMQDYIVGKAKGIIPTANLRTTTDGIDTLGDLFSAKPLIKEHIGSLQKNQRPRITVITSSFHLQRTEKLSRQVYADLIDEGVATRFIGAKQISVDWGLYWWHLTKHSLASLTSSKGEKIAASLANQVNEAGNKLVSSWVTERAVLTAIFYDIGRFDLSTPEALKTYLYNLPVYKDRFDAPQMDLEGSAYRELIKLGA